MVTSFILTVLFFVIVATASFSIDLIHRDSLFLPSDPNLPSIRSQVTPHNADHFLKFFVGTPPVEVLAVMDTGSDLTWVRCNPCVDGRGRRVHLFDQKHSSTYKTLPCDSEQCKKYDPNACTRGQYCSYVYGYGDGSFTSGDVSTETLTFDSTSGKRASFPGFIFGCGYNNSPSFDEQMFGIAGLGGTSYSLISQLGPEIGGRFSYCLPPFQENTSSSFMNFGDKAMIFGNRTVSTAIIDKPDKTFYFVTLEAVSVGGKRVDASRTGEGNMFIDTGTTVSLIKSDVFWRLGNLITEEVKLRPKMDPGNTFICYEAGSRDGFPDITFHFAGGADVVLKPLNAFTVPSEEGMVCLAMQATNGTAVFGNMAQQDFHVGFDLLRRKVAFQPTKCSQLGTRS